MKKMLLIAVGLIACLIIGTSVAAAGPAQVKKVKSKITLAYAAATTKPGTTTPGTPGTPGTPCTPDPYSCNPYNPYTPGTPGTPGTNTPGTSNNDASFNGTVTSKKKACKKGRSVKVKNTTTSQVFGTAKTNKAGTFSIKAGAGAPKGTYVAKVKKKVITKQNGNRIVCKRAKSKPVTVS